MTLTTLPLDERESDEQLTDQQIGNVAKTGNLLGAVRLYRLLHSVGLNEARDAVQRILTEQQN